jgi:acyl transferase domain-containing protein/acyl carrier protein/NRPS condensation-like uncharacterized protein
MDNISNNIAIIGMSGVFPEAKDLQEYYNNLCNKRDCVREPPRDRLLYINQDPNLNYTLAGHLDRIDLFDHLFFNIAKKEAEFIEPTQRIALQLACEAIENAGYSLDSLKGSNTGIYLGSNNLYPLIYLQGVNAVYQQKDPTIHTGTLSSMVFGRIAYELQLTGPAVMIDTGCSSSIIAINEAIEKLIHHKIDYALVGAVNLKSSFFEKGVGSGHLQASSPTGKSRAFDADADGTGVGEGGGMLLLKRMDQAIADNDNIHAIIKGVGVSQDGGRSNSITAPSPEAQTQAITQAWENAQVNPETIRYIETHGAGTRLGDVIEFQALTDAFNHYTKKRNFCAISAVKSNIGHLGNAAGIAGVIKGVLSLKNKVHFPTVHFNTPNPFIDFDNSGVFVNTELTEWKEGEHPRRCGVSGFGLSGTNAHLILEEAPVVACNKEVQQNDHFLKISAKSLTALSSYINKITGFITESSAKLSNILYTLNKGRSDYAYRIGINASSKEDLLAKLNSITPAQIETLQAVKQKEKKVILLFATEDFEPGLLEELSCRYEVVKSIRSQVKKQAGKGRFDKNLEVFTTQYALYNLVLGYGIPVRKVMGTGIGSIVTKVITGTIDLAASIEMVRNYQPSTAPFKGDMFKNTVKELLEKQQSVFLEIGAGGIFIENLSELKQEIGCVESTDLLNDTANFLPAALETLYNYGVTIDWSLHYKEGKYFKVEAPTYPFDKIRCWYDTPFKEVFEDADQWFYELDWTAAPALNKNQDIAGQAFLLFCDKEGLYKEVVKKLGVNNTCILAYAGEGFNERSDTEYEINMASPGDYNLLCNKLIQNGIYLDGIIYLNAHIRPYFLTVQNHQQHLYDEFLPLYLVVKAFNILLKQPDFKLINITSNAFAVSKTEKDLVPVNRMVHGFLKAVIAEYPMLQVTSLDLDYYENTNIKVASLITDEIATDDLIRLVAIRGDNRFIPKLTRVNFNGVKAQEDFILKEGGVYVITGGASGIGLETCKLFTEQGKCTLIIIGRTDLQADEMNYAASEKTAALDTLKAAGATVEYYSADVNNYARMQEVMEHVNARYKKIDGVVHASGVGSSGVSIENRELTNVFETLNPKFGGTVILNQLTKYLDPEFFILFSSIGSIVPSKNCADYTVANAFEDAFAQQMHLQRKKFIAINWSDWKETGLLYRKNLSRSEAEIAGREKFVQGLTNREGLAVIKCALSLGKPQVAIAKVDLSSFKINPFFIIDKNVLNEEAEKVVEVIEPAVESAGYSCTACAPCATDVPERNRKVVTDENLTETELKVIGIWYDVLKLDNIHVDDDFYEIGGHSLNIMQLLNLIKKRFGIEVGLEEMLYNSTVKTLALRIDELLLKGDAAKYELIKPLSPAPYFDISHAQKRFWILNQLEGREAYNVPLAFALKGDIKIELFQKAFEALVERHESLRTSFILVDGQPRQKILPGNDVNFKIKYLDLIENPESGVVAQEIIEKEAGTPFDLSVAPLIRALLIGVATQEYVLCITMHHIVTDARSIAIIKTEILKFYKAFVSGTAPSLRPLPIQYKDFAAWQNSQLAGDNFEAHKKYWFNRLENIKTITLPADFNASSVQPADADKVVFTINADDVKQLRKLSERNSATIFVTTLAIFNVLLSKYAHAADIVLATPVSGRDHGDLEDQVGIYLNTLLLRNKIDEEDTFNNLLKKVKHNTNKDFEHQIYPYDLLAQQLQNSQQSQAGLFNIGFTWSVKNEIEEALEVDFLIEDYATGFVKAKTDLWMLVSETDDHIHCSLVFKTSLFKKETVEILTDKFILLIKQVITGYDKQIKDIDIKLPSELLLEEQKFDISFSF